MRRGYRAFSDVYFSLPRFGKWGPTTNLDAHWMDRLLDKAGARLAFSSQIKAKIGCDPPQQPATSPNK